MELDPTLDLKLADSATTPVAPSPTPVSAPRTWWRPLLRHLFTGVLILGLSYGTFQFVTHYLLQVIEVVGVSMTPTLQSSHRYMMNRWIFHFRDPRPTDIVVLRDPSDNGYAVKRIVAQQGDTVYVADGHLFVNGKLLDEPYLPEKTPTYPGPQVREQMWICGINQYFVLGDNRNNSADSRIYGAVPRENILGLVTP
ncbi:MAG: signal peptidase I [Verrucomicrobiae bacterium]|nr:signal peptidase I [Verrucomicrobiae bacterium]